MSEGMDHKTQLKITQRRPGLLTQPSTPSLKGMEIGLPPEREMPPPTALSTYEARPLPPVPSRRRSWSSTFSSEVDKAFSTPKGSVYYNDLSLSWSKEEADIAVMLDAQVPDVNTEPHMDVAEMPISPASEIPPLHLEQPVQKDRACYPIASIPTTAPLFSSSPAHDCIPSPKVERFFGSDISPEKPHVCKVQDMLPLSPTTSSSSIYSQDRKSSLSESDADVYLRLCEQSSSNAPTARFGSDTTSWGTWDVQSAIYVPLSLNVTSETDKLCDKLLDQDADEACSLEEPRHLDSHASTSANSQEDCHHASASNLARSPFPSSTNSLHQNSDPEKERLTTTTGTKLPTTEITIASDTGADGSQHKPLRQERHHRRAFPLATNTKLDMHPPCQRGGAFDGSSNGRPPLTPYPTQRSRFDDDDTCDSTTGVGKRNISSLARVFMRDSASLFRASTSVSASTPASTGRFSDASSVRWKQLLHQQHQGQGQGRPCQDHDNAEDDLPRGRGVRMPATRLYSSSSPPQPHSPCTTPSPTNKNRTPKTRKPKKPSTRRTAIAALTAALSGSRITELAARTGEMAMHAGGMIGGGALGNSIGGMSLSLTSSRRSSLEFRCRSPAFGEGLERSRSKRGDTQRTRRSSSSDGGNDGDSTRRRQADRREELKRRIRVVGVAGGIPQLGGVSRAQVPMQRTVSEPQRCRAQAPPRPARPIIGRDGTAWF